ncbi:MAG: choice-of-anchor U domain-containing protein [Thermodesulfobacteriota bacterium]
MKISFQNQFTIKFAILAISLALLFPLHSEAQTQVTLEWQSGTDSDIAGHRVFSRLEGETYDFSAPSWEGSEASCVIDIPDAKLKYFFIVFAYDSEKRMSQGSNEVCYGCTLCPNDPYKNYAGFCGCGVPDMDIDSDGIWDCYDSDDDNDGIDDTIEDNGPNRGDSNYDEILDSLQSNVGSIKIGEDTNYMTIETPYFTSIRNFKRVDAQSPEGIPNDIDFSFGLYEYDIYTDEFDESVTVTITLPEGVTPDTYYSYGITPDNQTGHWYEFIDDGETGVDINGNIITIYLVDALRGDDILDKDYKVKGLGGPGFIITDPGSTSENTIITESEAGCFIECLFQ